MAQRTPHRIGDPCWVDLYTGDPDRTVDFYGRLFGWTADRADPHLGGYITFRKDGAAVAGGAPRMPGDTVDGSDRWTVYLAVDDATATVEAATDRGGSVVVPAMPVAALGTFAILGDPGGAGIGIWQAGEFPGFETRAVVAGGRWTDTAGAPSWFELATREYEAVLDFYRDVFGWDDLFPVSDDPAFRYVTLHSESPMLGGVMDAAALPAQVPTGWTVYFGAEDVDATAARAAELGGTVVSPPEDSPYGRMAVLLDPGGARFSIGGEKS